MADLVMFILMTVDGNRWLPHTVTGPGNHFYNGSAIFVHSLSEETTMADQEP